MDDRYDNFGNLVASKSDGLSNADDEALNRKAARSAAARKGRVTAALMRTRTQIGRLVDRLLQPLFVHNGVVAHFTVLGEQSWDGTLLCWLVEGVLWLQDKDYIRPRDLPIAEYSHGERVLTVRINRDRSLDLSTSHESEKFSGEIEVAKLVIAYFFERFKDFDCVRVDPYAALRDVEMWLRNPAVVSHLRSIIERFDPVVRSTSASDF